MCRSAKLIALASVLAGCFFLAAAKPADAQVAVTTFYPPQPVVTYLPVRRGLFFPRIVYRPVVSYAATAPVTTYYAPPVAAAPVATYYAPAPVTSYCWPGY